jgi:hypothetical protein
MAYENFKSGEFCAGIVAAGVAGFFIGIVLLIYGMFNDFDPILGPDQPVFVPLAFRTTIIVWLGGWCWLHFSWRKVQVQHKLAHKIASVLTGFGVTASVFTIVRYLLFYVS